MMGRVAHKRLFLIDTFGFIFRAYHARARSSAPPMRTSTGISTEAVYIFNNMLRKLAKQYGPEYIAAVFESGGALRLKGDPIDNIPGVFPASGRSPAQ
jgi:DNA polymerase-1